MKNPKSKGKTSAQKRVEKYAEEQGISIDEARLQLNAESFAGRVRSEVKARGKKALLAFLHSLTDRELLVAQVLILRVMQARSC